MARITSKMAGMLAGIMPDDVTRQHSKVEYVPTEAELGLIAWAKLTFDSWRAMEAFIHRKVMFLENVSLVDETRFRGEARKRGIQLPQ